MLTHLCVLFSVLEIHITSKFWVLGLVQSKYLYFTIFTQHCDQFWCSRICKILPCVIDQQIIGIQNLCLPLSYHYRFINKFYKIQNSQYFVLQ
jgi:hypothetical protein